VGLLQITGSIEFGYFIDCSMFLLTALNQQLYIWKLVSLLIGCVILGTGVYMEVAADVVMLPGESFVSAWSTVFNTDFGTTKVAFDTTMTLTAALISVILFHKLNGVREGTIIAALLVG
ncbi:MAG: hypothetical protein LIO59_05405, partial [Oscillospiraceae bacterium]|nr:hypothetical protein [Oscillospiraceae bacterium]